MGHLNFAVEPESSSTGSTVNWLAASLAAFFSEAPALSREVDQTPSDQSHNRSDGDFEGQEDATCRVE